MPAAEARRKAMEMLDRLGAAHLAERPPHRLSGGEKRLAALAGILVMEPQVIVLDEPTSALDPRARRRVIETLRGLYAHFLVQEFIAEAKGADLRCFVVGDRVVAAMRRQAPKGDFRSNLHRGGTAKAVRASKAEIETAVRAARVLGLGVAGVDLIRSKRGPLVLEVNSSPGLEGIEEATGIDVAGCIIEHVAAAGVPARKRSRNADLTDS